MWKNYTPHTVKIVDNENKVILEVTPEKEFLRVMESIVCVADAEGVPYVVKRYEDVFNLPKSEVGVSLIVSTITQQAIKKLYPERGDIFSPDSGPDSAVYEGDGKDRKLVAVRRLQQI